MSDPRIVEQQLGSSWDGRTTPFGEQRSRETLPANTGDERANFRTSVINLERPGDPSVFSEAIRADALNLIARYPVGQGRSALLPMLHLVQSEQGYITPDGIAFCADMLDLTKAQVAAVATFYTMFKRHPTGEYLVSVCTNTLCGLMGGDEIFNVVADELGLANNETSADGSITIERAECLAACDYAPVVTVNYEFFDNQSVESTLDLVGQLRGGQRPLPTRGAPLCSFKQAERQIAGFFTESDLALEATATGAPSEAGVRLAIQRGDTAPSYAAADDRASTANGSNAASAANGSDAAAGRAQSRRRPKPPEQGKSPEQTQPAGQGSKPAEQAAAHQQGPSESDAPLSTSQSDPANPSESATEAED